MSLSFDNNTNIGKTISGGGIISSNSFIFPSGTEPPAPVVDGIKQLVSTDYNFFVLMNNGDLYASGYNNRGQLGLGTNTNVFEFTKIATDVKQVAAAITTTWIVKNDGSLWGCGRNDYGQQGSGDNNDVNVFTQRLTDVKSVHCGAMGNVASTTWAIKNDGSLWGCGRNDYGQQADNSGTSVLTFTKRVSGNVKDVMCDAKMTWYIDNDNKLYGCGYNNSGQQGSGNTTNVTSFTQRLTDVIYFESREEASWALKADGTLWGCGLNENGQQGSGNTTNVKSFTQRLSNVSSISCSKTTTWAVKTDGTLWGCGYGGYGNQSSGTTSNVGTFTQRAINVKNVYATLATTWYIDNDDKVYGCGQGYYGQQGNNKQAHEADVMTFTYRLDNAKEVALNNGASFTTWVWKKDDTLWSCGWNNYGQQGVSDVEEVRVFTERTIN